MCFVVGGVDTYVWDEYEMKSTYVFDGVYRYYTDGNDLDQVVYTGTLCLG